MQASRAMTVFASLVLFGTGMGISLGATGEDADTPGEFSTTLNRAKVAGLRITDLGGNIHTLGGAQEPRATALVFLDTGCPISQRMLPRLGELAVLADGVGLDFFGVLSDPTITRTDGMEYAQEYGIEFPVLFDASGVLARTLRPTHVPHSFVIDTRDRLCYSGRIDDRFAAVGKLRKVMTNHELEESIRAVAKGEAPAVSFTTPVGCVFEAWSPSSSKREVTYHRDIAPILNAHCVSCHRQGEVAPFALQTYAEAERRAQMVAMVCETGFMPPWAAEPGAVRYQQERRLREEEIDLLQQWAQSGAPEGDPADGPTPPQFDASGWTLGEPDLVLTMPEFEIPAEGDDLFHYFVIPSELVEDQMVVATDFKAGDASVTHHSIYYSDSTGQARELDEQTPEPGYPAFTSLSRDFVPSEALGGWSPGSGPQTLPEGVGIPIQAGADIILEMHYHLSGKATTDASQIAIYFADGAIQKIAESFTLGTLDISIPPNRNDYWRKAWAKTPVGITLLDLNPHMHLLGKEAKVDVTYPDGSTESLLWVSEYDFRWQDIYRCAEPIHLPAGTRLDFKVRYDNTSANPSQPHIPPRQVVYGEETNDEMCFLFCTVVLDDPERIEELRLAEWEGFLRDGEGNGWGGSWGDWKGWSEWKGWWSRGSDDL